MAARRRVSPQDGARAARQWAAAQEGQSLPRQVTATAVRFTLEELAACAPGRSVEVRVPPFGAVQAVAGTVHRRGTPPSVVETDAATWLALATGRLGWQEAMASGALAASGERCDLSPYLPLLRA
ncbi:sterol carrier family protein [uncultured Actinomyces sp.]|uniref:sterol carrier family protein n=1 Tax=uncultured Actinomyces sp. TaxID=249061 RepID=UPI0026136123|nr:sterol carrier family protein [uncultured Actinomyces sp.]